MRTARQDSVPPPVCEPAGLTYRVLLKAIYTAEAAQYRIHAWSRNRGQRLARLIRTAWPAGGPVLFLVSLCLLAACLLALEDLVPAMMFLLAGCSALVAFVVLAHRSAIERPLLHSDVDAGGTRPIEVLDARRRHIQHDNAERPVEDEGFASQGFLNRPWG